MSGSTLHEEKPRRIRLSLRKVMDSRILSQSTTSSESVFCLSECIAIDMAFPTSNRGSLRRNFFKCKTSNFVQSAIILSWGLKPKNNSFKKQQESEINLYCILNSSFVHFVLFRTEAKSWSSRLHFFNYENFL